MYRYVHVHGIAYINKHCTCLKASLSWCHSSLSILSCSRVLLSSSETLFLASSASDNDVSFLSISYVHKHKTCRMQSHQLKVATCAVCYYSPTCWAKVNCVLSVASVSSIISNCSVDMESSFLSSITCCSLSRRTFVCANMNSERISIHVYTCSKELIRSQGQHVCMQAVSLYERNW